MAQGRLPQWVLLEDANDLADFIEAMRRTIPRTQWAVESIAVAQQRNLEGLF